MTYKKKNHYVILNRSPRILEIIKQIRASESGDTRRHKIIIIHNDGELSQSKFRQGLPETSSSDIFKNVHLEYGDPCEKDYLEKANVLDAEAIIILADERDKESADAKTLRSLMALKLIAKQQKEQLLSSGKSGEREVVTNVVVELVDPANAFTVEQIAEDADLDVDLVAGEGIQSRLLAHAAVVSGLTEFYKDLLEFHKDSNELYTLDIPDSYLKLPTTFPELAARIVRESVLPNGESNKDRQPVIPVGVRRLNDNNRWDLATNPGPDDDLYKLQNGDQFLVIAYHEPRPLE